MAKQTSTPTSKKSTAQNTGGLDSFVSAIPGMPSFDAMMKTAQETGIPKSQTEDETLEQSAAPELGDDSTTVAEDQSDSIDNKVDSEAAASESAPAQRESKLKGRKEPAPDNVDYATTFLQPLPRGRKGKHIVLPDEIHEAVTLATTGSPDKLQISDFVANVLKHHFEQYGPQIRRLIAEKERKSKTNSLF